MAKKPKFVKPPASVVAKAAPRTVAPAATFTPMTAQQIADAAKGDAGFKDATAAAVQNNQNQRNDLVQQGQYAAQDRDTSVSRLLDAQRARKQQTEQASAKMGTFGSGVMQRNVREGNEDTGAQVNDTQKVFTRGEDARQENLRVGGRLDQGLKQQLADLFNQASDRASAADQERAANSALAAPAPPATATPSAGFQYVQTTGSRVGQSYKLARKGTRWVKVYESGEEIPVG